MAFAILCMDRQKSRKPVMDRHAELGRRELLLLRQGHEGLARAAELAMAGGAA